MKVKIYEVVSPDGTVEVFRGTFKAACKKFKGKQREIKKLTRVRARELSTKEACLE